MEVRIEGEWMNGNRKSPADEQRETGKNQTWSVIKMETPEDRAKVYLFGVDPEGMKYVRDNGKYFGDWNGHWSCYRHAYNTLAVPC